MNKPVAKINEALATRAVTPAASQSTTIEQSRAVAEVQSMVVVAQNYPRNEALAITRMREACAKMYLAERAFFKFPRGGSSVEGKSVHLARELARCWGNISHGVSELDRDDFAGRSEMVAYAWDVQTNARAATNFIVPHMRDKKTGAERLVDMRDIYENNANNAARRLREMIFSILPKWYVEEAEQICRATLEKGEGTRTLPQRRADAIEEYAKIGVSLQRMEAKLGAKVDAWTSVDIAGLVVSLRSIKNKEITADEEFPSIGAAKLDDALKPKQADDRVPVLGATPADDTIEIIRDGDAAESAILRDKLIDGLADMPDADQLASYCTEIADDLARLSEVHRGEFATAKIARQRALAKAGKK